MKMNLDTGAAVNTFPLNFGPEGEQEMEDSIGLPVVNGFQMVELDSFQGYDENGLLRSLK